LWLGVTAHPTAEWIARQLPEACGWELPPKYLIPDRDGAYGDAFKRRVRAMGIRDKPTAPRSPWQNGHCERLIGSIRRECLDYVVVFGKQRLRQILLSYLDTTMALEHISPCARTRRYHARTIGRSHSFNVNSRRIASSICADLICDRDRGSSPPRADL
jgi:transposase InsO family protein